MAATRLALARPPVGMLLAGAVLLAAPLTLALAQAPLARWVAMALLAWLLPGLLLVALWRQPGLDAVGAALFASGLGLCWLVAGLLLLYWLPGPIALWPMVGLYEVGALALLLRVARGPTLALLPLPRADWAGVALLLLVAVLLRLPGLDYHDFHYDETRLLLRARDALAGQDDVLARHQKGPGEIAVAALFYRAIGTVDEGTGRLPFALASVASVLAVAWLGRRMVSPAVGWWAGLLLALNGFAVGLSRIVQYQGAILLLMALAVWAAWEFAQRGEWRWLFVSVPLVALGVVLHYEFALLAPVLALLAAWGWQRASRPVPWRALLLAAGLAALFVGVPYLQMLLDPHFGESTQGYLGIRLGDGRSFNLPFFLEMGAFYNSLYFFVGLLLLLLLGLWRGWRQARRATLALVLWFAPFLVMYLLILEFPGTHFYTMMGSWSLLAALPLATLAAPRRSAWRWGALAGVALWVALAAGYLYLLFFRQQPEFLIDYPLTRVPLYPAPLGVPEKPRFGFPIREGWKPLGVLTRWGVLRGTYASNDRGGHTEWYTGGLERVELTEGPDYVFMATHPQERDPRVEERWLEGAYQRVGEVRVRGIPRLWLWAREPWPAFLAVDAARFEAAFDEQVAALAPDSRAEEAVGVTLGEGVTLEAMVPPRRLVAPGGTVELVLFWRANEPLDQDLKLFVHLGQDAAGAPLAQWDGFPALNSARTSQWAASERVADPVFLPLPSELPVGEHALTVGLYDPATGERLGGRAIPLGTVRVVMR